MRTVAWVTGISRLSKADLYAASLAADKIGTTTDALLAVMRFESGLNPAARNG